MHRARSTLEYVKRHYIHGREKTREALIQSRTYMNTRAHTHKYTHTHTLKHTHTNTYTHTHSSHSVTHIHEHARAHTHTHTDIHTHTHTYTNARKHRRSIFQKGPQVHRRRYLLGRAARNVVSRVSSGAAPSIIHNIYACVYVIYVLYI